MSEMDTMKTVQREYNKSRKLPLAQRFWIAVAIVISHQIVFDMINSVYPIHYHGWIKEMLITFVLLWASEFSYEFTDSKWVHTRRSNGKNLNMNLVHFLITWLPTKVLDVLGFKNQPTWIYIFTAMYCYGVVYHEWQVVDAVYHIALMVVFYNLRKWKK